MDNTLKELYERVIETDLVAIERLILDEYKKDVEEDGPHVAFDEDDVFIIIIYYLKKHYGGEITTGNGTTLANKIMENSDVVKLLLF